ncbi:MAG: diaminopimelate epimerase [Chitinophagaceae bacterium]
MSIHFYKYQGTGNDFIILDNRDGNYSGISRQEVNFLCDRKFGIGADGLMLLATKAGYDFEMKYFNSDGNEGSMCGNGGRCLVKMASDMGMRKPAYYFLAVDGEHEAEIDEEKIVSLKMKDVDRIMKYFGDSVLDTGSPHYVKHVTDVMDMDVFAKGKEIRNSAYYVKDGINVNFVEQKRDDEIIVRTYERGVEVETLSCGTGVTASALVSFHNETGYNNVRVITKGGRLEVEFDRSHDGKFTNIWLSGPAEFVFEGEIEVPVEHLPKI